MKPHPVPERRAFSVAIYPIYRPIYRPIYWPLSKPHHEAADGPRALLILHKRLGVWLPPGGELNPGETPLEAARRELFEETGLSGSFPQLSAIDGTPPGLIGYEEHVAGSKGRHLNFVFVATVDTDAVQPNGEFTEWRWVRSMDGLHAPENVGQLLEVALRLGR